MTENPTLTTAGIAMAIVACGFTAARAEPPPGPEELFSPPVPYLSPEQSQQLFDLPEGYRLELVVSEPKVREPVAMVFDGNGRMFVAEMRTYMQDIDGTDSRAPIGRISVHWSSQNDGVFDRHEVFIDELVLPRMMLPLDDSLLVAETDTNDIYEYRDTTGDNRADERTLRYDADPSSANLEHQTSGLTWAADNWIYTTYNPFRLRWTPEGKFEKEPTAPNGGQWGLTQDNYGKPWFVNAGGEIGPLNFQQPIVYGDFSIEGELEEGFREVFPLVRIPDVEGGPDRFRPEDNTLNHFTATCGQVIFRGDRLPRDLANDLLFAEPVGRLIRRAKVAVEDGVTRLRNAHPGSEFIRSRDPNFRPVNMENGPDGQLYIADMYRGIIQEANWVREGSYLREVIKKYGLHKNHGRGRIWRLVHEDHDPGPQPRMLEETAEKLVEHLSHPNGWWRDTAQRLLIVRQAKSVAPDLETMALTHPDHLARFHALWTLEGLGELTPEQVRRALEDTHPQIRIAAIRAGESLFKEGDESLRADIPGMLDDSDPNVVIQTMLTADHLNWPEAGGLIQQAMETNSAHGVTAIARRLLERRGEAPPLLSGGQWERFDRGRTIYRQHCFSCHARDGQGARVEIDGAEGRLAPSLADSDIVIAPSEASIRVMLHGLVGDADDKTYPGTMVGMGANDDEWIASVLTYIRNAFGNRAAPVHPSEVAQVRDETAERTDPWTKAEIRRSTPRLLQNRHQWSLAASDNPGSLENAIDGNPETRYTTRRHKNDGMWLKVTLPAPETLTRLELDAGSSTDDFSSDFTLEFSRDGDQWDTATIIRQETGPLTTLSFAPVTARYLRLTNHEDSHTRWWSIHDLRLFAERT